jgi:hypothetical protein
MVLAGMVGAYLAANAIDASGSKTSYAIGIAGATALVFRTVYSWWLFLHLGSQERERFRQKLFSVKHECGH